MKVELTIEQVLRILEKNPNTIAEIMAGMTDDQAASHPDPEEWSVTEILAHLRSCSDLWEHAIQYMLAEDHPRIKAVNPRLAIRTSGYPTLPFSRSFADFRSQRESLLKLLHGLTPEQWNRGATVYGAGKELERTVLFYARWLARHERSHLRIIRRTAEAARS
jgi:hypothetical protein